MKSVFINVTVALTLFNSECSCSLTNVCCTCALCACTYSDLDLCCRCTSKGMVLKIIPVFCVRLPGHIDVLDQRAKLVGINCVVQRSIDAEPLGSDTVNVAATEFKEGSVRTPCMKRAKEYLVLNVMPLGLKAEMYHRWLSDSPGCVSSVRRQAGIYTAVSVFQVDKETNTESLAQSSTVVRPKDKRAANPPQSQFVRGSTIIRSKTFSPGPQSQYVCRVRKMQS